MRVIDGLMSIKKFRETSRENELRRTRDLLAKANDALQEARLELQRRNDERAERERSLYQEVFANPVVVRDLEYLRADVDEMRGESQQDEAKVQEAQDLRQKRREDTSTAEQAWRVAVQSTEKIVALANILTRDEQREAERLADLELEEVPYRALNLAQDDVFANQEAA